MSKEIAHYADESMFKAEAQATDGPTVVMLAGPPDPLGLIAQTAKTYQGIFPASLAEITDEDRDYYVKDVGKNMLGSPMETVQFTFQIKGVTRAFTHQLVRQRHGTYQQESMRFAVKEDFPVKTPDMLIGVLGWEERAELFVAQMGWATDEAKVNEDDHYLPRANAYLSARSWASAVRTVRTSLTDLEQMKDNWDNCVQMIATTYHGLVANGMPAEQARGLAPTDILTNINYTTSLRALMDMSGMRLCTQAQHEWKTVWLQILDAMVAFGETQRYARPALVGEDVPAWQHLTINGEHGYVDSTSEWQYSAIAKMFAPVCYQTGACKWQSDFDRYCVIRDRVQANAAINRPSSEWHKPYEDPNNLTRSHPQWMGIPAIRREEWMDPRAAISPDGEWRSDEAKANIAGRRL